MRDIDKTRSWACKRGRVIHMKRNIHMSSALLKNDKRLFFRAMLFSGDIQLMPYYFMNERHVFKMIL